MTAGAMSGCASRSRFTSIKKSYGQGIAAASVYPLCAVWGLMRDSGSMIELSDVIADLRSELDAARRRGTGEELRFELGSVELEVSVAVPEGCRRKRRK